MPSEEFVYGKPNEAKHGGADDGKIYIKSILFCFSKKYSLEIGFVLILESKYKMQNYVNFFMPSFFN